MSRHDRARRALRAAAPGRVGQWSEGRGKGALRARGDDRHEEIGRPLAGEGSCCHTVASAVAWLNRYELESPGAGSAR